MHTKDLVELSGVLCAFKHLIIVRDISLSLDCTFKYQHTVTNAHDASKHRRRLSNCAVRDEAATTKTLLMALFYERWKSFPLGLQTLQTTTITKCWKWNFPFPSDCFINNSTRVKDGIEKKTSYIQQVDDIYTKTLHPKEYAWSSKHNRSKSHQQQSTPHRNEIYYGLPITNTAQESRGM